MHMSPRVKSERSVAAGLVPECFEFAGAEGLQHGGRSFAQGPLSISILRVAEVFDVDRAGSKSRAVPHFARVCRTAAEIRRATFWEPEVAGVDG